MLNRLYKKLSKVVEREGYELLSVKIGYDKSSIECNTTRYPLCYITVRKPCKHTPNTEGTYKYLTFCYPNGSAFVEQDSKWIEGRVYKTEIRDNQEIHIEDDYKETYVMEDIDRALKNRLEKYLVPKKHRSSN